MIGAVEPKRVQLIVDNRLRLIESELPEGCASALREDFTHNNPQWFRMHGAKVPRGALRGVPKTLSTWVREGEYLALPRGGISRVRAALREYGISWSVVDQRIEGNGPRGIPRHRVELRDYQERMVQAAIETQNCLLRAPTASGKTTAALALAARLDLPTLVVLHKGGLLRQWVARAKTELGLRSSEVGIVGEGKHRIRPLTIALWQSAQTCIEELMPLFGLVLVDEVQRAAARCVFGVVDSFPAKYRIGVSALEKRGDRKEFLVYDVFGDVACEVSQKELVELGRVHDVEVRVVPTGFDAPWYRKLRASGGLMPLDATDELLSQMMVSSERNAIAVDLAVQHARKGEPVVMFSHRREHCRRLDADVSSHGIRSGCLLGGKEDAAEFERVAEGMRQRKVLVGCGTYQSIGEGIDLPAVSAGVCTTPIANSRDGKAAWGQVVGRIARIAEGKSEAVIYYCADRAIYGLLPVENLCRWNHRVLVLDGGEWVDGKAWLKAQRETTR